MNTLAAIPWVLAISVSVVAYIQNRQVDTLKAEITTSTLELNACGARLQKIVEDVRDDARIDTIPDDDLRNVPDDWLR